MLDSNNISIILNIISSENIPENIQICVLEAGVLACHNMRFRKQIVKNGFISALVNLTIGNFPENLKELGLQGLLTLCTNPTKGVYIPGKSREHSWIKEKIIVEGGVLALLKILKNSENEEKNEKIGKILASEFFLAD